MTTSFEVQAPRRRPVNLEKLAFGFTLILVGLAMALGKLDLVDVARWHGLWPLFLVVMGLTRLATAGQRQSGLFWLGLGLIFGAHSAGWATMRQLWPLFLVLGGVAMLTRTWEADRALKRRAARHGRHS